VWQYCTHCKWVDVGPFEVDSMQGDLHVITEKKSGKQHNVLVGSALERQRTRTAPPGHKVVPEPEFKYQPKVKPAMTSKEQYAVICPGFEKYVEKETPKTETEGEPIAVAVAEEEPTLVSLESLLEDRESEEAEFESEEDSEDTQVEINPNDWFEVTITRNSDKSLTAQTETNESVHIHKEVVTNSPGQHTCPQYIPVGSKAICRLKYSPPDRFCPFEGLELVANEISTPVHETAKVIKWEKNHYGKLIRECGCKIFGTNADWTDLYPGNEVEFDVEWTAHKGREEYVAKNIKPIGLTIGEIYE
jgi:hypothetical protein